tara:strand:+ start:109 stop:474 length:366 start_codon:yes stop_codon:yes gene_type:complete
MIKLKFIRGKKWQVDEPIKHRLHDKNTIIIPKGFTTDLSSVPMFLWGVFPPFGNFLLASVVHDYLYVVKYRDDRYFCDKEMLIISNRINKNKVDNYIRYIAVRLFGWIYWCYVDMQKELKY